MQKNMRDIKISISKTKNEWHFNSQTHSPRICEEIYKKKCNIVFSDQAENVTEEACYTPYSQECDHTEDEEGEEGEEVCVTLSDTSCVTRYVPKQTADGQLKHVGQTSCDKLPQTLCSTKQCRYVQVRSGINL